MAFPEGSFRNISRFCWQCGIQLSRTVQEDTGRVFYNKPSTAYKYVGKKKSHSTEMLNYMSVCRTEHAPKKTVRAAPSVPDRVADGNAPVDGQQASWL